MNTPLTDEQRAIVTIHLPLDVQTWVGIQQAVAREFPDAVVKAHGDRTIIMRAVVEPHR